MLRPSRNGYWSGSNRLPPYGGKCQALMPDPTIHRPEHRQQPAPGIISDAPTLPRHAGRPTRAAAPAKSKQHNSRHTAASSNGSNLRSSAESMKTNRIITVNAASYSKDQAAHLVPSSLPATVLIGPVNHLDQNLHRMPHLQSQLIGDFLLVIRRWLPAGFPASRHPPPKKPLHPQQTVKRPQGERLIKPQPGIPGGETSRLAARRIHQHPLLAVRHQPQPDLGGMQQLHHPRGDRSLPAAAMRTLLQQLAWRINLDQQARFARAWLDKHEIWSEGLLMLRKFRLPPCCDAPAPQPTPQPNIPKATLKPGAPRPYALLDHWHSPSRTHNLLAANVLSPNGRSSNPCGKALSSTGIERNGPEISSSESHSAWWRVVGEDGMV